MKKLFTVSICLLFAALAFGQWEAVLGPVDYNSPTDAVALSATTVLTINGNVVNKTVDFGANWTEILLPEGVSMSQIDAASDQVAYACGDGGLVYKTEDAGATWTQVGDTSQYVINLKEIDVLDANTVFIAGASGLFMKTTDGGANWDTSMVGTEDLDGGVAFVSATNGIVFADGNAGVIWTTHDGGATWTDHPVVMPLPLSSASKRMYCGSAAAGTSTFVVGAYFNIVWLSTDGGDTWTLSSEYTFEYDRIIQIEAFDANNIMAFTSETDILKTTDGGATWDTLNVGSAQSCQAIAFSSPTNGMIWSSYNQEYSTTDGSTFVPMRDWPGVPLYSIIAPEEGKLIATGTYGGEITISEDNGATWSYPTNEATKSKDNVYASVALDANTIIIGGSSGYIAKSTDGGATWTTIDNPMVYESNKHIYMLYAAPDGKVFAGGSSGWLLVSEDSGDTWTQVESASTQTVYGMQVFSNGMAMLGQGSGQFSVSTSTSLDTFELVADYGTMSFRTPKESDGNIFIAGGDNVYKTTIDALDTLVMTFDSPTGDNLYGLAIINDTVLYVAGDDGAIFVSEDAGLTWEQEFSVADDYIYDLLYVGDKLWAVGKYGLIMSRDVTLTKADYTEEFTDGTPDLTWVENTTAGNGTLNLTVAPDSAGLTNVGIWTDDDATGLIYADLGRKVMNYEVSADVYIVKEASATQPLYKGIAIKMDPVNMLYYRFVYRNSSTSSGALKLQGFDGASWYISKQWDAGVDFDTLETGFHNFKAQVINNKFWLFIDGELLSGCPYTHDGAPLVTAGYPGMYVYTGVNEFDNFKVKVFDYPKYNITANVDMGIMVRRGEFVPASSNLDIIGTFDGWAGTSMTDVDGDTIYTASLGGHEAGTTLEFKCRRNGAWDNTEEFPYGGANRTYTVTDAGDQVIPTFMYGDIEINDAIDGVPTVYALEQNYPNPFNPTTTLKFQIPNAEMVTMTIYDVAGRKVAELVNKQLEAGYYTVNFNASTLPSGMYIYRLHAGEFTSVKKMTLLK